MSQCLWCSCTHCSFLWNRKGNSLGHHELWGSHKYLCCYSITLNGCPYKRSEFQSYLSDLCEAEKEADLVQRCAKNMAQQFQGYRDPSPIPNSIYELHYDWFHDLPDFDLYLDFSVLPWFFQLPKAVVSHFVTWCVNVLDHAHALLDLPDFCGVTQFHKLDSTSSECKSILLQVKDLWAAFSYKEPGPSSPSVSIYVSSYPTKPPIIINTGASCSISPLHTNFLRMNARPDLAQLKEVNGTAEVVG